MAKRCPKCCRLIHDVEYACPWCGEKQATTKEMEERLDSLSKLVSIGKGMLVICTACGETRTNPGIRCPMCGSPQYRVGSVHNNSAKTSVLKGWVMEIGWKMQSILLSGLRAPDVKTVATKKICRWMRAETQNNADPSKGYMEPQTLTQGLLDQCMDELEYLPCHYVHHFADAMRIIALHHPDETARKFAWDVHFLVAEEIFHFKPESDQEFLYRHRDQKDNKQ